MAVAYNASRNALFHPGSAGDFFQLGALHGDAALCAEMSRLAYVKEASRLEQYFARARFTAKRTLGYGRRGTQAFIADRQPGTTVVAFRGSEPEDPSDIFDDADFAFSTWRDAAGVVLGRVHDGFARAAHDGHIFAQVKAHLDALPAGQRILITGHSLGAALATLLASWTPAAHLYTFGSPRVGDADFVRHIRNPVAMRYVHCRDIVTRVPPDAGLGYCHAGTLVYIDRAGALIDAPEAGHIEADRTRATIEFLPRALLPGTVFSRDLADHAPINYVSAIMGLRPPA
jgi:hypothetical protein